MPFESESLYFKLLTCIGCAILVGPINACTFTPPYESSIETEKNGSLKLLKNLNIPSTAAVSVAGFCMKDQNGYMQKKVLESSFFYPHFLFRFYCKTFFRIY